MMVHLMADGLAAVTPREAASLLHVSAATIRSWQARGWVSVVADGGREWILLVDIGRVKSRWRQRRRALRDAQRDIWRDPDLSPARRGD